MLLERTRFGAQVRASVDNAVAAAGLGINVNRVFALTFALGSGLAGLGGGLGIDVLGLDPTFPLKYMVYFLLVVAVGGAGTIKGALVAAMILGVFDVAGKYYVPADRRLRHLRADGRAADPVPGRAVWAGEHERVDAPTRLPRAATHALPDGRWRPLEIAFWLVPVAAFFLLPDYRVLGSQILIAGLFALSLDLILGYAGIVSLGHAAFFGIGAYTAGLLAVHGWGEPLSGLARGGAARRRSSASSSSFLVVRGSDLDAADGHARHRAHAVRGGQQGGVRSPAASTACPASRCGSSSACGASTSAARTAYLYSLAVLFVAVRARAPPRALAVRA